MPPADGANAQRPEPIVLLEGAAAEAAHAQARATRRASEHTFIESDGVGPFRLGMSRADLEAMAGAVPRAGRGRDEVVRVPRPFPVVLRFLAGRLVEIRVQGRYGTVTTSGGIGVGSSMTEAEDAHGAARASGRGWVLDALPGVVFVPVAGAPAPDANAPESGPGPGVIVGEVVVVGPESD